MVDHEHGTGTGSEAEQPRRTPLVAWLALAAVVATVAVLLVLDLWMLRTPAQRGFITRNLECLRCHADLVPRLDQAFVHQPFLAEHCESCHTTHGYERQAYFRPAEIGPRWLRVRLEQIGLRFVWDALVAVGARREPTPEAAGTVPVKGAESVLKTSEEELCWTCHGNLAPDLLTTYRHAPFVEGHCTSCHDPHASDSPTLMRASTSTVCASCHRVGPELLAADVHLPFGRLQCTACHAPHASSQPTLLVKAQRDLCFGCHSETAAELGQAVAHDPFANGSCTGCHRPHSASFAPLLATPQPELCYRCHSGVRGQFAAASRHPVPSRLLCADCHRPHAAPVRGLLPVAQRQLCLGCHTTVRADLVRADVHASVARGDCTGCHVPHGSSDAPLLQASDPALCRRCHPGIPAKPVRKSAPKEPFVPTPPRFEAVRPGPMLPASGVRPAGLPDPVVAPGRRSGGSKATSHRLRRCGECHHAHASDYQRLLVLPGDVLCLRCHRATASRMGASAHAALTCDRCHSPHNASAPRLLKRGHIKVCTSCHAGYTHAGSDHPVGSRYYDYLAKGALTCASTCHDPHGSRNVRMLRVPYNARGFGSDYVCLLCHTKVGVVY